MVLVIAEKPSAAQSIAAVTDCHAIIPTVQLEKYASQMLSGYWMYSTQAYRVLKKLADTGKVRLVGKGADAKYILN